MSDQPKDHGTYQLITPPNALKARVGVEIGVDRQLAKKADSVVQNMQGEFLQRLSMAVGEIAAQLALAENTADENDAYAAEVFRISRDLQTQGAAFGYPLASDVCASLCGYIENLTAPETLSSKVVSAHIDVLRSVIGHAIDGDGGRVGQDLVESLNDLVARSTP